MVAGFEELIRKALARHDQPSPQQRAAVYRSSQGALERMIAGNDNITDETADAQRKRLGLAIQTVEREYRARVAAEATAIPAAPPPAASRPLPDPPTRTRAAPGEEMARTHQDAPVRLEPAAEARELRAERASGPSLAVGGAGERRPYARMLLWVIILTGIAVAIWWAVVSLPALVQQTLGGAVPNPSPSFTSGPFDPAEGEGWVTLFDPQSNPQDLDTAGAGEAILLRVDNATMARLTPPRDGTATMRLRLPPGPLEDLRGKAATFEILAKADAGENQQFALQCRFASLGKCGRKRFRGATEAQPYIFDVLLNDADLETGETAYLDVTPDLQGQGRPLDLFAVRVRESR